MPDRVIERTLFFDVHCLAREHSPRGDEYVMYVMSEVMDNAIFISATLDT